MKSTTIDIINVEIKTQFIVYNVQVHNI